MAAQDFEAIALEDFDVVLFVLEDGAGSGGAAASGGALPCPFAGDGEDLGMFEDTLSSEGSDRRSEGYECQERDPGGGSRHNR